ncbi:MAG: hypothetical protein DMG00_08660, partial [Acidobacteria bacterium]
MTPDCVWFQSGADGLALCGAWQKMQISVVPVERTVPVPLTERLCLFDGEDTGTCARAVDSSAIAAASTADAVQSAAVALTAPP